MTWAKVDDRLHDHPKIDAMLEAGELQGAAALGLWVAALSYAADQLVLSDEVCVVVVTDSALVAWKDTDDYQVHLL
jgi:hypothetical protein